MSIIFIFQDIYTTFGSFNFVKIPNTSLRLLIISETPFLLKKKNYTNLPKSKIKEKMVVSFDNVG